MRLYAFGSNGSGQLGVGHEEDLSRPQRCLIEDSLESATVKSTKDADLDNNGGSRGSPVSYITAGGNHTLLLFRNGAVFAAGRNDDGRCGHVTTAELDGNTRNLLRFTRVVVEDSETGQVFKHFRHVAATWEGSIFVTNASLNGLSLRATPSTEDACQEMVFVSGSGPKGALGLGRSTTCSTRPIRVPGFPPTGSTIMSIASGMGHVIVILSNGDAYGWGTARKGQLGEALKQQRIVWTPTKIQGLPFHKATQAACGREFTIIIGDMGSSEFAILGAIDDKWGVTAPPAMFRESLEACNSIAASWHGIYAHGKDSSVVAWGRNDRGQLPPANLPKAKKVAIGSEHALALLHDDTVVAFGWGEHGNCGPETDSQGNVKDRYAKIPLDFLEDSVFTTDIAAGCATSWIITA